MSKNIYIVCAMTNNREYEGSRIGYFTNLRQAKSDTELLLVPELEQKEDKFNLYIVKYPVGFITSVKLKSVMKVWKRIGIRKWKSSKDVPISYQ